MTNIKVGRHISDSDFGDLIILLSEYFKKIKEHRTIDDVERAIEYLKEKLDLYKYDVLKDEEIEDLINDMKEDVENYFEKNRKNIKYIFRNPIAKKIIPYWISNFDLTIKILVDSLKVLEQKRRRIILLKRQSRQTKEYMENKFENILKAVFLVLFRIIEQIFLIIDNKVFNINQEIDLLIRDVVYLKNIQRKNELLKY
ncbi:MAG: hypothetical protein ACFFAH_03655 [Promethearchaeota archaeon]